MSVEEAALRIKELLARVEAGDVGAGRRVGVLLRNLKASHGRYGANVVQRVALASGACKTQLYAWEQVARDWTDRDLAQLLRMRGPQGQRLKKGHLLAIAGVRPREEQAAWIESVLCNGLTVRALLGALGARRRATFRTRTEHRIESNVIEKCISSFQTESSGVFEPPSVISRAHLKKHAAA